MRGPIRRGEVCHKCKHKYNNKAHRWKLVFGLLLFFLVLAAGISYGPKVSKAAPATVGTVSTSGATLNVRSAPDGSVIGSLPKGSQVTILGEEDGWYVVSFGEGSGYVSKEFVSDVRTVEQEEGQTDEYADGLVAAGFPSSYATALSSLHAQYPNWTFKPIVTGLEWDTVIQKESGLGLNLVDKNDAGTDDAQKSTDAGAYDWATNKWNVLDASRWVGASPDMIRYCMDPRNFLDAENIFQFATNEYQESQNAAGVQELVKGTFMEKPCEEADGSKSYADIFVEIGKKVGVNPYHLAARCLQEQGKTGTSGSISGTVSGYEGYYNYFNIRASGLDAVQAGLKYAKEKGWDTRYKSILGGAEVVAGRYVKNKQNTVYFEKFNVVNAGSGLYGNQYMTNVQAAISEGKIRKKAYVDLSQAIEFQIPVYEKMPETPCAKPSGGNPNNWLSGLSVEGQELTPAFSGAVTEYSLIVGQEVEKLNVSATPVASTSSVSGTGEVPLQYGSNAVAVKCVAQNQTERTYTINVVREEPEVAVVRGDANGDGEVSLADWVAVKRHMLDIEALEDSAAKAVDINGDGEVGLPDWVAIKRHILGYEALE